MPRCDERGEHRAACRRCARASARRRWRARARGARPAARAARGRTRRLGALGAEASARRRPAARRAAAARGWRRSPRTAGPPTIRTDSVGACATGTTIVRACAALDHVHVERRLGGRADVELGSAACASAGRAPTLGQLGSPVGQRRPARRAPACDGAIDARRAAARAGGRPGRGARRASARCSAWNAFSAAPPYMPECAGCVPVRTSRWAKTMPRVASVSAGVSASTMPLSKTITASAPRSSAQHPLADVVGAGLLGALDQHAHVDRQLAGRRPARTRRAAAEGSCPCRRSRRGRRGGRRGSVGSNGGEVHVVEVARVLDVVVAVDHHRRRVLAGDAQLADDQRRAARRSAPARPSRRPSRTRSQRPLGGRVAAPPRRARRPRSTGSRSQSIASSSSSAHR